MEELSTLGEFYLKCKIYQEYVVPACLLLTCALAYIGSLIYKLIVKLKIKKNDA